MAAGPLLPKPYSLLFHSTGKIRQMPSTEKPLVVVSGAAKGIGRACAEAFLATGWHVAAVDRDAERLSTFVDGKKHVIPIVTDFPDPASVEAATSQLGQP